MSNDELLEKVEELNQQLINIESVLMAEDDRFHRVLEHNKGLRAKLEMIRREVHILKTEVNK